MNSLDALFDILEFVRSLIRSHPCTCAVTAQGLNKCRRCLILEVRL